MTRETRFCRRGVELREAEGQARKIAGYGAVFYRAGDPSTEYVLWDDSYGKAVERILPGAFDRALRDKHDVRSLFNHDSNIVLGRTTSGTLALSIDETGLRFEATPPDTQLVRDQVLAPIQRGDVSGSSFMFIPMGARWTQETVEGKTQDVREISDVELWEVGPVTFPAYEGTSSEARSALREEVKRRLTPPPAIAFDVTRRCWEVADAAAK